MEGAGRRTRCRLLILLSPGEVKPSQEWPSTRDGGVR